MQFQEVEKNKCSLLRACRYSFQFMPDYMYAPKILSLPANHDAAKHKFYNFTHSFHTCKNSESYSPDLMYNNYVVLQ